MPVFTYTAKNMQGQQVKGELNGENRQYVLARLRQQQLFPLQVDEKKDRQEATGRELGKGKVKKKQIAIFTRQFASMLHAGVPLPVILDVMIRQEGHKPFRTILEAIQAEIMKGNTLSLALSRHKVFPPLLISMVEVGEANGMLDIAFERIALTLEKEVKIAAKIKGAMIYPMVLLSVTVIVMLLLSFVILPIFVGVFEDMGVELPALTVGFLKLSRFITGYWYWVLGITAGFVYLVRRIAGEPDIRKEIDHVLLRLPVIGQTVLIINMARFCRTFSALMEAGVGVIRSLETVRNVITNQYMKGRFEEIIRDVQKGTTITQALSRHWIFTPLVISMSRIGEESGRLGETLAKTAEFYEDEADSLLQKATSMLEPAITVIMALGVGFVVMSIVQPMFQMYTSFGKGN